MDDDTHTPVTVADKRAIIVDGTSGLGQAIAVGFAADGADVIATSRDEEKVNETATLLEDRGATTARVTCDVTDPASLERVREVAEEFLRGIDIVVASLGRSPGRCARDRRRGVGVRHRRRRVRGQRFLIGGRPETPLASDR